MIRLLSQLSNLGVELWIDGEQLRYRAPTGVMTQALLEELATHKAEIIDVLRSARAATRSAPPSISTAPRDGGLPLSFAQQRLWFLDQLDPDDTAYTIFGALQLRGVLDVVVLRQCLTEIVRRHESLRTTFRAVEGKPVQVIVPELSLALPVASLGDLPSARQESEVQRLASEERRRPFDLARGPLVRTTVLRLSEQEHVLLLNMHHIISDGWSMGVLVREMTALYRAFVSGGPPLLPDLAIQYADFGVWQREWLQGELLERQLAYWRQQLDGVPGLELPADRPRPPVQSHRGARVPFALPENLAAALKALCREEGCTLFMALLAAFDVLLHRYTGQTSFAVGSPIANRNQAETGDLIGFFVNTLVLRADLSGDPSFRDLLGRVRETTLGAYAHQDMPFELLVEELRLERDLSRTPLFQVMLVLQNAPAPPVELEGLTVRPLDVGEQLAPFDLVVMMAETKRGLLGEAVYSTDLFDGATIARLVGHFQALLGDAVANPGRRVSRLALLEEPERHQLRTGWNDTLSGYPRHLCIHHLFAAQSSRAPDAVAVVFGDHHVGYGQLERRANRVAHLLRRQGTGPAALVGIWADRSPEVIAGLLGILKSGAGYVPLDPGWPVERVRGILSSLDVPCIVVDHARSRSVYELQYDLPALADIVYLDVETPGLPPEPLDTAAVRQVFDHVAEQAVDRVSAGGFVSSFTGKPFADAEVDAYRDRVVGLAEPYLGPHKRVLEIGCGSGLITFALSPRVGAYVGLDPSEATQARNRERVAANGIANVRLVTAFAHEIDALDLEPFDLVIIASTVQFFPGPAYLEQTIGQTLQLLRPGGAMLIADVMDAGRKQEFRQSLEAFREQHRDDPGIRTRTRLGSELYVDERFFLDLQAGCEDISGVRVLHRGDGFENELRFRYDVLLTRGGAPPGGRDGGGPAGTRRRVWTNWHLDRCPDGGLAPLATPDDVAYVIHTSGSTGAPKGVVICHEAAVNLIDWVNRTFRVGPGDRVLFVTSLCFDLSVYDVFGMLAAGGTIQVPPEPDVRDGERLLRLLRDRPVTFWDSAPAAFQQLVPALSSSEPGGNVERLRLVFLSGDWIPVTLPDTIGAAFPNAGVISLGGATEATIWSNYYPVGEVDLSWPSIPYGRPIQNAQYYVLDSYLNLCPIGAPGDLYIGGTCLATGYANSPGLTASKFIPCPFGDRPGARLYRTGDMARFLPDGNIEFLGRSDLQVKVRGFRIELGEVEAALAQYPAVQDAVVLAREDGPGDRRLVAYVVPKEGRTVAVDEVRRFLQEKLPEYMVPSLFVTLGALPLTPNGKVDRRALPQPDRTRPDLAKEFVPPRTPVEEMLADVWAQVLGIERIGVHDSFFDLGGHSLLATQVVSRVCDTFRVDLVLRSFFEAPTVAGLAQTVAALQFEQADADDLGLLRMVKGFSDAEAEAEMARLMDRESKGVRT